MLNRHLCLRLWTAAAAAALASTASAQKAVQLRLIPSGFSDKIGQYKPVAVTLSTETPESVKKLPADLKNTKFGALPFTTSTGNPATVAVGERDGRSFLFIDANTNGDLTDDREPKWQPKEVRGEDSHVFKHYYGTVELPLATAAGAPPVQLVLYLFDPADLARAEHKDKLFCYSDF
ncbi:MAG: hypothetical protein HZB38_01090, partial [Planctomycetes bacterium]|nr:hypothetical protein [Planctomycetota bacterium]